MGGDDFVIVLPNDEKVLENLKCRITGFVRAYGGHTGFLPAFGFYVIDDISLSASQMYDRAILAQETVKGNYAVRCAYYSSDMKTRLENNHVLLAEVQAGLERDEFIYYLQPKCNLNTGKIVGLESLVRWKHPEKGIVAPGYFIPVMESNGLITELDMKVWEQVCQTLQDWIKADTR
ncbi:MAG: EAL domain-containing protein [Ruminococcus sp.]